MLTFQKFVFKATVWRDIELEQLHIPTILVFMTGGNDIKITFCYLMRILIQYKCTRTFNHKINSCSINHPLSRMSACNGHEQSIKASLHLSSDVLLARKATSIKKVGLVQGNFSGNVFHESKYSKVEFQQGSESFSPGIEPQITLVICVTKQKHVTKGRIFVSVSDVIIAMVTSRGIEPRLQG